MAIFKVGQRVRIVRVQAADKQALVGTEATIYCIGAPQGCEFKCKRDTLTVICDVGDQLMGCAEHNIEPLQPERNSIVSWESLPIDPRKIGEEVT